MKDKALQREQTRERVRRYRNKQDSVTSNSVTLDSVTEYPAVIYALADPIKREKLRRICQSLKEHNALEDVYYGVCNPVPMNVVADYLVALS